MCLIFWHLASFWPTLKTVNSWELRKVKDCVVSHPIINVRICYLWTNVYYIIVNVIPIVVFRLLSRRHTFASYAASPFPGVTTLLACMQYNFGKVKNWGLMLVTSVSPRNSTLCCRVLPNPNSHATHSFNLLTTKSSFFPRVLWWRMSRLPGH